MNLAPNLTWFSFTQKGRTKDSDGYYRISVGPKVLIPDYSDEGKLWAEEFSDTNEINIKVTAKLKLKEQIIDKEGNINIADTSAILRPQFYRRIVRDDKFPAVPGDMVINAQFQSLQ